MNTPVERLPFPTELATHIVMSSDTNWERSMTTTGIIDPNFDVSELDPAKFYTEADNVHVPVFPPSPDAKNIMVRAVTAELLREYRVYEPGENPYEWSFTNYFTTHVPVLGTLVTVESSEEQINTAAKKICDVHVDTRKTEHITVVGRELHTKLIASINGIKKFVRYGRPVGSRSLDWAMAYQFRDGKWSSGRQATPEA